MIPAPQCGCSVVYRRRELPQRPHVRSAGLGLLLSAEPGALLESRVRTSVASTS